MKVGSLFSGIGGFDLGLERAGMRVLWQVENDKRCQRVLAHHWPEVERFEDVRTATGLAPVDLVCGGFPCQDLSVAGRRAGLDGQRSGLWFEFQRVVSELRPEWVLIENVPGLLSSNDGRDMALVLWGLEQLGYRWAYRVLDSQYFGVAQRRRRVFIVGCSGEGSPAQILFDAASLQRHPPSRREERARVAGTLEARAATGGYDPGAHGAASGHVVAFNCQQDPIHADGDSIGTSGGADRAVAYAVSARDGKGVSDAQAMPVITEKHPRRLTPRECERLQGFPDDWTLVDGMADGPRYRMLGNAVTVNVAEWIGRRIMEVA
jgi:DNA (cytosine-5)-methyltransferase 1